MGETGSTAHYFYSCGVLHINKNKISEEKKSDTIETDSKEIKTEEKTIKEEKRTETDKPVSNKNNNKFWNGVFFSYEIGINLNKLDVSSFKSCV